MQHFQSFSKNNFSRILVSPGTDKQQLKPFHIISVNNLDFRLGTLPTSLGLEQISNHKVMPKLEREFEFEN